MKLKWYGLLGLAIVIGAEVLLFLRVELVTPWKRWLEQPLPQFREPAIACWQRSPTLVIKMSVITLLPSLKSTQPKIY